MTRPRTPKGTEGAAGGDQPPVSPKATEAEKPKKARTPAQREATERARQAALAARKESTANRQRDDVQSEAAIKAELIKGLPSGAPPSAQEMAFVGLLAREQRNADRLSELLDRKRSNSMAVGKLAIELGKSTRSLTELHKALIEASDRRVKATHNTTSGIPMRPPSTEKRARALTRLAHEMGLITTPQTDRRPGGRNK